DLHLPDQLNLTTLIGTSTVEVGSYIACVLVTVGRRLLQHSIYYFDQPLRCIQPIFRNWRRYDLPDSFYCLEVSIAFKRQSPGGDLIQHNAERKNVRQVRDLVSAGSLFGRHVADGAQQHSGLRQTRFAVASIKNRKGLCEAEIQNLHLAFSGEHDIRG